jgi:DNA topoisomerase-1
MVVPATRRKKRRAPLVGPFTDPLEAARAAALRHVTDDSPGITRKRSGAGFSYRGADGALIRDRDALRRIRSLAIPPAWTSVWICPQANGHIQATGRDVKGRKQYRYHPRWSQVRDETKYNRMIYFGDTLPVIRTRLRDDLALPGMPREKVLAVVVRLLELTFIRVGNEEYARNNRSFGLTTLLDRHVTIEGSAVRFKFRGKSGKTHDVGVHDRRLAKLVQQCRDLPGQDLFQYVDDAGAPHPITSADVNDYLRQISGQDFTAKDFRTWAGTLLAVGQLVPSRCFDDDVSPKTALLAAVASVADRLGNTVAVCRKCYIHPQVLNAFQNRAVYDLWLRHSERTECPEGLHPDEAALLLFLRDVGESGLSLAA